ncbi:MAG: hypothetical protein AWU56_1712 [Idiomarina sp. T82-3]|jgi:hypothetical protein|uniref:hypothetical protein n=1 Tax=Idiomarina TaxID=135575 RepID=UPI00079706B2|nr:hypothetical protein [Idiomarina sp. T82-3]KXS34781.1 MAG: hypothetical protein AWU56_1712 [Idiomarina sp. T82-3]
MPTYRVNYDHLGAPEQVQLNVPTIEHLDSDRDFRDEVARRLAERVLPHAELAVNHDDHRNVEEKLYKAYDLKITHIERL